VKEEEEKEEEEEKGHCVATRRGLLVAFLPPVSSTLSCSEAKMEERNECLSRRRFSSSETGLLLSRVCKTAFGNTVRC